MSALVDTLDRYAQPFFKQYGHRLSDAHRHALSAIRRCRTEHYGQMTLQCPACEHSDIRYHSCGHRSCPRCQNHDNTRWLERQQAKLLPVDYFMVTFTLPAECRSVAWKNQKAMYAMLFDTAVGTCRDFARSDKHLQGDIGLTAVLHTQTRRLDYHPHVHVIIPGGAIDHKHHCWRTPNNGYLFSQKALAKVFRARMLKRMQQGQLLPDKVLPDVWVVDCRKIGNGLPALKYLSRYLYRGVIGEKQLVSDNGKSVTFSYQDARTKRSCSRTVSGAHFIWLLIQHVLPTGFRRVRDYGFLHGNARKTLVRVQWFLKVAISVIKAEMPRPPFLCKHCGQPMSITGFLAPQRRSG
jgi:hypothetical protein